MNGSPQHFCHCLVMSLHNLHDLNFHKLGRMSKLIFSRSIFLTFPKIYQKKRLNYHTLSETYYKLTTLHSFIWHTQFMKLSPKELMILSGVLKGDIQNVQNNGSPGPKLKATAISLLNLINFWLFYFVPQLSDLS